MYKPDDKDIDRLSRDAAEHYHAPGTPSWDALQQVLDKELPQEKEKKRRGFFFFFLLLLGLSLAGSAIWYGGKINSKPSTTIAGDKNIESKPANNKTTTIPGANASGNAATVESNAEKKNLPASTTANAETSNVVSAPEANNNKATAKANSTVDKKIQQQAITLANNPNTIYKAVPNKKYANIAGAGVIIPNKNQRKPGNKNGLNKNTIAARENNTNDNDQTGIIADNSNTSEIKNNNTVIHNPDAVVPTGTSDTLANTKPAAKPVAVTDPETKATTKDSADTARKKTKAKHDRAINIGLTAGLDLSTVKFTHSDNVGYNFGLMGGYQFSKHWSVYTGLIYTKKNYTLNGSDYHPPKHYWTQYVDLRLVEGYCRMWEVPLLARYTFNPSSKIRFFASTGLSSYFMKEQYYDYSYKNMQGMPASAQWTNDSTFNHVFSILHLSGGFEKNIGKHMNLQVEPYAKIPLSGVGFGDIRLSSFGINFSVQYRHPLKR